jgi:hypothetical protein
MSGCGPFVFVMIEEFTQYIVECQEDNIAVGIIDIVLPPTFNTS